MIPIRQYNEDGKLISVTCNNCCTTADLTDDEYGHKEEPYKEIDAVYGYGSELYDESGLRFDLCEYCMRGITSHFTLPPENRDYQLVADGSYLRIVFDE